MKKTMRKTINQKGFTLIELVIVIAVLGVLAMVAVPVVSDVLVKAKDTTDKANHALYQSAIERGSVDSATGEYPASQAEAVAAIKKYTNKANIGKPSKGNYYYVVKDTGSYKKGQVLLADADPDGAAADIVQLNE